MKFKVGDWVREKRGDRILQVESIEGTVLILKDSSLYVKADKWELWEPKVGEWCWFFDNPEYPDLRKFIEFNNGYFFASGSINYSNCKPFIGKLPSFIKED